MYHLNHVYAYGPVTRRAFMLLRGHHHHPSIPTAVSPSHRESVPTPPLQVPGNQHSAVCLCEFTALGTSSKWGQKVFVRAIWLMSLSAMSSRVTCVALHQSFTLFEGCLSFHCESVAMFLPSGCFRPQQLRDGEKESPGRAHCPPPFYLHGSQDSEFRPCLAGSATSAGMAHPFHKIGWSSCPCNTLGCFLLLGRNLSPAQVGMCSIIKYHR